MRIKDVFKISVRGIRAHKSRSMLTILGIVIGVTAVVLVVSIGRGAESLVLGQVASLGSRTIAVAPGREPEGPTDPSLIETLYGDSLKAREVEALEKKSNVPHAAEVMPIVFGIETVSHEGETFRPMVLGASPLVTEVFDVYPEAGTFFTDDDVKSRTAVAVIGSRVKKELFGDKEAIGEKIRIGANTLKVVGVSPPKGQVLFFNFDETVIVPHTFAQQYVFGIKYFNRVIIQVDTEENVPRTVYDVEVTLRALHDITDPEKDDFFVGTQAEIAATVESVTGALTLFLASVAAISLIVGGIGIMNIMLVSITERTQEIGLRKAIGATRSDILLQFLFEAAVLTTLGGLIGVLLGIVFLFGITLILSSLVSTEWKFVFPIDAAIVGIVVSIIVGLVFGLYPARAAAKKDPIEALQYE
ncbi:MAG: ABC transporter permease [Candidatus Jorgensenbacteria bacterium]